MATVVKNREGRVLSVISQRKYKDGDFVVVVDTEDLTDEAYTDGVIWGSGTEGAIG